MMTHELASLKIQLRAEEISIEETDAGDMIRDSLLLELKQHAKEEPGRDFVPYFILKKEGGKQ